MTGNVIQRAQAALDKFKVSRELLNEEIFSTQIDLKNHIDNLYIKSNSIHEYIVKDIKSKLNDINRIECYIKDKIENIIKQ